MFITSRVSLSYSILNSFPNFTHYQNKNIDITTQNKLIIQLDSLSRLIPKIKINPDNLIFPSDIEHELLQYLTNTNPINTTTKNDIPTLPQFDIIALDEIESLLYHLSFDKLNTNHIFKILIQLCINAKTIIAMDGDFSNRAYTFLNTINNLQNTTSTISTTPPTIPNNPPVIIENIFKPQPKHFIFTNDFKTFEQNINDDLANNTNIVIISMTMKHSEYFYNKYNQKYKTILHNSIQNDRNALSNINAHWNSTQCLIYTSTIQEGCDFNLEWFHKAYIILSDKSTTPRALMQMTSRVRKFHDSNIMVFTNSIPFHEFQYIYQYQEIKTYLNQINNTINNTTINTNQDFNHITKQLLNDIICYNQTETLNRSCFITVLTNLLRSKGHTYEYIRINTPTKPKLKSNLYQAIADSDNINSEAEYKDIIELIKQSNISPDQQRTAFYSIKKYLISKIWNIDITTLIIDDIKKWFPRINKLLNYKYFIHYIQQPNITYKHIPLNRKIHYIQTILARFGIRHQDDFQFSIDCGSSVQGRKLNRKENPLIINADKYKEHATYIKENMLNNRDFRITFVLGKTNTQLSDRKLLETIKKVIAEFGFVLDVIRTDYRVHENGIWTTKFYNKYLIDLDDEIIDFFNRNTRYSLDELIDGDDTIYINDDFDLIDGEGDDNTDNDHQIDSDISSDEEDYSNPLEDFYIETNLNATTYNNDDDDEIPVISWEEFMN